MKFFPKFSKKGRTLDSDEEFKPNPKLKTPKNKEFKDLASGNKEKRKEPEKPWGRKERLIVLAVFFTTTISAFVMLVAGNWKFSGFPIIKKPNIDLNFFEGSTFYDSYSNNLPNSKMIIEKFNSSTNSLTGFYSFYVIRLNDGSGFGINETVKMQAASLIKLPVIMTAYFQSERGMFDLGETYSLVAGDKIPGSGSLYNKPVGYKITFQEMLMLMGKQSDNTAFGIVRRRLGDDKIVEVMNLLGMSDTNMNENLTTAYDISLFFENLWNETIVSEQSKKEILDSLTGTIYENYLPAGLPESIKIAHKYGAEVNVINDCGIVISEKPYIICIMGERISKSEADIFIPEFSRFVFTPEE